MMEPVANDSTPERIWAGDFNGQGFGHCVAGMQGGLYEEYILASRLSDAEARIRELEAKIEWLELEAEGHDNGKRDLAEVLNCADEPRWKWMRLEAVKLKDRTEAAEALLKEAGKALKPFAKAAVDAGTYYHDTTQVSKLSHVGVLLTLGELRAARAIHDKIGVKDE